MRRSSFRLLPLAAAICLPSLVLAEEPAVQELPEVVVTSQRIDKPLSAIPGAVTVIEGEALEEQLASKNDVEAALRQLVAGYNDDDFPSIRGRRVLVLINGTPQNETLRESSGFELENIDPAAIERIEVIRGATSLYGYGAPGGVINIITKAATSTELKQQTRINMRTNPEALERSAEASLYHSVSQIRGDFDYHLGLTLARQKNGFDANGNRIPDQTGDSEDYGLDSVLGYRLDDKQKVSLRTGYRRRDLVRSWSEQGGNFPTRPGVAQHDAFADDGYLTDWYANLTYENKDLFSNTGWKAEYFRQYHYDTENQKRGALILDDQLTNESWGVRNTLDTRLGLWRLTYGLDFTRAGFKRPFINTSNNALAAWLVPPVELDTWAPFFQMERPFGDKWLLNAGLRHERYQGRTQESTGVGGGVTGGETKVETVELGNIGLVYYISDSSEAFAGISQGTDITQLGRAARSAGRVERIHLEPDPSTQYELGWRQNAQDYTVEASVFYTESDKGVTLIPDPADPVNLPLIAKREPRRTAGLEVAGDYRFSDAWQAGVVLSLQEGEVDTDNDGSYQYQSATDVSPPRLNTWVAYSRDSYKHRLQSSARFARNRFSEASTVSGEGNIDEEYLFDYILTAKIGGDELSFAIHNLFNEDELTQTSQAYQGDFYVRKIDGRYVSLGYSRNW